jgi:hypothetical protein
MSVETGLIVLKSQLEDMAINIRKLNDHSGGKNRNLMMAEKWVDAAWAHIDAELERVESQQ